MSEDRADGEIGHAQDKDRAPGRLLADRSSHWQGKSAPANGSVRAKDGEVKDTRRFADGRTR